MTAKTNACMVATKEIVKKHLAIDHLHNGVTNSRLVHTVSSVGKRNIMRIGTKVILARFVRMPFSCCTTGCTNRFKKDSGMGFYVFPTDKERREHWLHAISRDKWEPKASDRICKFYFVGGRPSKGHKDVNYVPTLFGDRKRE